MKWGYASGQMSFDEEGHWRLFSLREGVLSKKSSAVVSWQVHVGEGGQLGPSGWGGSEGRKPGHWGLLDKQPCDDNPGELCRMKLPWGSSHALLNATGSQEGCPVSRLQDSGYGQLPALFHWYLLLLLVLPNTSIEHLLLQLQGPRWTGRT